MELLAFFFWSSAMFGLGMWIMALVAGGRMEDEWDAGYRAGWADAEDVQEGVVRIYRPGGVA